MTYTQQGNEVIIQMTRDDYSELICILGIASGYLFTHNDKPGAHRVTDFLNRMNQGNPAYVPHEMPASFRSTGE